MSTMMTFEYLSQLCQNKEQVFSLQTEAKDVKGEEWQQFAGVKLEHKPALNMQDWNWEISGCSTVAGHCLLRG